MLLTIFPGKRSSKISFQTSPEVRHRFRRRLRQLHSGNCWCLQIGVTKRGSPRFVPIFPFSSDLFRFAFLVFVNAPIYSDLLQFLPICSENKIRANQGNPFLPTPLQVADSKQHMKVQPTCRDFPRWGWGFPGPVTGKWGPKSLPQKMFGASMFSRSQAFSGIARAS